MESGSVIVKSGFNDVMSGLTKRMGMRTKGIQTRVTLSVSLG